MIHGRTIVLVLAATVALGLVVATVVVLERRSYSFAENVCLCETPRAQGVWERIESPRGSLFRARHGKFAGWYLAADDSVNASEPASYRAQGVFPGWRLKEGPYVRNLYLRETRDADCYWRVSASARDGLHHIQATSGRYAGWHLDLLADYIPDTGRAPRTAWNLALHPEPVEGSHWRLEPAGGGLRIRATTGAYEGWCLDSLEDAKVLERRRNEPVPQRDRQTPPLLDVE